MAGQLLPASHTLPQLDLLVSLLQAHSQVYGARLTGAGFGGACVALCRSNALREVSLQVLAQYARDGGAGRLLVPPVL